MIHLEYNPKRLSPYPTKYIIVASNKKTGDVSTFHQPSGIFLSGYKNTTIYDEKNMAEDVLESVVQGKLIEPEWFDVVIVPIELNIQLYATVKESDRLTAALNERTETKQPERDVIVTKPLPGDIVKQS